MKTPFPWTRSGRQLFASSGGIAEFKRRDLVAKFTNEEDAATVASFVHIRDEILTTLRVDLLLLKNEMKQRQLSGILEYIDPIEEAVRRTERAIALAEGWR